MSSEESQDVLLLDKRGPVAELTLNRPDKLNSFDGALRAALRRMVGVVEDDDEIRVVILRGAGRGFCAGADLSAGISDPISFHLDQEYKPFMEGIAKSSKIWIGEIHGAAAGAGAALAMNCDLMVMAEDAYVYMAFAAIALIPDAGNTRLLLEAMGYKRALQAALEGRKIPAAECLEFGICNKVVSAEALTEETRAWADRLAAGAPRSMAAAKRLFRSVGAMSFGDAITAEGLEQTPLLKSEDFQEGVRAFFAKEKPVFKGA
ncbi:MAG: enoyl-CoA hydratase-related protein [Pseudomonadota bacterium]